MSDSAVAGAKADKVGEWPARDLESVGVCPVCGAGKRTLLLAELTDNVFFCAPGEWRMYRCEGCGSGYLDPRPTKESIGRAYASYYTHASDTSAPAGGLRYARRALANGYRNRRYGISETPAWPIGYWLFKFLPGWRVWLDAAMRQLPPVPAGGGRLLDIGCGNGEFLARARQSGWRVLGVDPDPAAVQVARAKGLKIREGGVEQLSDLENEFDGITLSHVIEHVHDPVTLLGICRKLLKPNGWIWIETPNIDALGRERFAGAWRGMEPPRHLVLFSAKALEDALKAAGFANIEYMPFRNLCPSMYAQSIAIERGTPEQPAALSLKWRIRCWLDGLKARFKPAHREFITISAIRRP